MIANMDAWVRSNTLPPASAYPKISDGTLVPLQDYKFPNDSWSESGARSECRISN